MRYVLGVDGGGSRVACLVADETGTLLAHGRAGGVNANYLPRQEAMDNLKWAVDTALKEAGPRGEEIEAVCLSVPMDPNSVRKVMEECGLPSAIRAAEGETPRWAARFWVDGRVGVTVDGGTGSLARGWAKDGREVGSGGWGATLGDEGSGYFISMQAMIAVLQAHDGRIEETMLTKAVLEHLGVSTVYEIPRTVFGGAKIDEEAADNQMGIMIDSGQVFDRGTTQKVESDQEGAAYAAAGLLFQKLSRKGPLKRHEIASLCPVVVGVAQQGDWKALQILEEAGHELGRLGVAVIKRLNMEQEEFVVVPFGGVFRARELVLRTFRETILAAAPRAKIVRAKFEPEVGAVFLALDEIGVVIDDQIIQTIEQSSAKFPFCRVY